MIRCFIALGSNLDHPEQQVQRACQALASLPDSRLEAISPWYLSTPIGPGRQPDYINGVAELSTNLPATELLKQLQAIENQQQRVRKERWGPRTLDLDILLYGNQCINLPELTVPHPRMMERNFVLYPLADIAPDLQFPDGTSLAGRLDYCPRDDLEVIDTISTLENPFDDPGNH